MDSYLFLFLLATAAWLELGSCVSLPHHLYRDRSPRGKSTDSDTTYTLRFDLITNTTAECVERLGSNVSVELSYRTPGGKWNSLRSFRRSRVRDSISGEVVSLPQDSIKELQGAVQFRWRQQEQAWGSCNCWQIGNVIFSNSQSNITDLVDNETICTYPEATSVGQLLKSAGFDGVVLCQGSASVPRGVVTPVYSLSAGANTSCIATDLFDPIGDIQFCARDELEIEESFIKLSFQLVMRTGCNQINIFDEGMELAARWSEDEQWVPLRFYTLSDVRNRLIDIGSYDQNSSVLFLRGYNVSVVLHNTTVMNVTEYICDKRFFRKGVQFRWLQTTRRDNNSSPRDTWYIDDVKIAVHSSQSPSRLEFSDDFSDATSINNALWSQVRGGRLGRTGAGNGTDCTIPEDVFFFGADDSQLRTTVLRMAVTASLNLLDPVQALIDLLSDIERMSPPEILLSLRSLLGNLPADITFPRNVSELIFNSVSDLIDIVQRSNSDEDDVNSAAIGSTLLDVMDRFALGPYDPERGELEDTENIALEHMIQTAMPGDDPSEAVEGITRDGNTIFLPREVFLSFNMTNFTVASYFYRNLSRLLPDSLPNVSNSSNTTMMLASGVLSSALQCGSTQCNTRKLNLNNSVVLVFNHPQETMDALQNQERERSMVCVFWDFDDSSTNELSNGQWATEGCTRNDTASNESHTVCECNHLTHFALLLSTTEVQLTPAEALSLRIIGIICVTISLVCLIVTILTFLFLKSLWSMRNYIHVNLCVSLFVAQLTFIVAVEPHGSVVGCQVVAVLLHYFFLVTFMWMLMEGVVLYVALVRVFIKHKNRYLIAFTLASYGIPLLYLGVTVPLGFALKDANGPHYAGDVPQSCWLRYDTHFIWAFIAPVIIIILANIGFLIMAITIMYRHQRRETHKGKSATIRHWLKASISLVVVMGITWIIGILVFNRDFLFVAYIYTIFIGLQGLAIFILFVMLSKQVREAYAQWWRVKVASSDFLSRHFGEKFYSQTAMTLIGTSASKNTLRMDNGKSRGTHNSLSPNPTDNDTLYKEKNQFSSTTVDGNTYVALPIGNVGGGAAKEKEAEALADAASNGSALPLMESGEGGNGEASEL